MTIERIVNKEIAESRRTEKIVNNKMENIRKRLKEEEDQEKSNREKNDEFGFTI